jgi:hypothetical protein
MNSNPTLTSYANSILFSPHSEPDNNAAMSHPLFLNSLPTTVSQHDYRPSNSYENHCLPSHSESYVSQSSYKNNHSSLHTKAFLKITLPSIKDIPILTGKHDWGPWHTAV